MRIKAAESLLLSIDLQERLLPAIDSNETVLANATWMVDLAQTLGIPVLATEQYPRGLGLTEAGLRARLLEGSILAKTHF